MSSTKPFSLSEIKARGMIRDVDVLAMRRRFYEDGRIAAEEAEQLFELDATCPVQDPAWPPCLAEMICDYLVNQVEPYGYLTIDNARWLIGHISRDGAVTKKAHLELLIAMLDKARWAPEPLVMFALDQVRRAVVAGNGPARDKRQAEAGVVSESDVEMIRRILYAFAGDQNIAISRAEAEMLLAIDEATIEAGEKNAAGWGALFVQALMNHVLAASGYAVPSREEALARDAWLDARGEAGPVHVAKSIVDKLLAAYRPQSTTERAIARLQEQKVSIITNAEVTGAEAEWLAERLSRDAALSLNERALLDLLAADGFDLHPAVAEALGRVRKAA